MPGPEMDILDRMIERLRDLHQDDEPLYATAAVVLHAQVDDMTEIEAHALETTEFEVVKHEGNPSEPRLSVPSTQRLIEQGQEEYDSELVPPDEHPKLMFLGFLAIAAERFMNEEDEAMRQTAPNN